jgi:hypothetical protein
MSNLHIHVHDSRRSRDVGASSTVGGQTTGYSINTSSDTKDDCDCKTTGDGKVSVSRKPSGSKRSGQFTLPRRK